MRILIISDCYFPQLNGVATSIRSLLYALDKSRYEAWLLVPDYETAHDDGQNIIRVSSYPVPSAFGDGDRDRVMRRSAIRKLIPRLRELAFQVIHIMTPGLAYYEGMRLGRIFNAPVVTTQHIYFPLFAPHENSFMQSAAFQSLAISYSIWQSNGVDSMLIPSTAIFSILKEHGIKTPMRIAPTGVELSDFSRGDGLRFRRNYGIDEHRTLLLTIGRLSPMKNLDFLLRVMAIVVIQFPDILLVIAGDGPSAGQLRDNCRALGLSENVKFVGELPHDTELVDCYNACDVFVFTSRRETQGLVILEAMAAGLPVIAISHLGTKDMLETEQGSAIAPADESKFAAQVCDILGDPERRALMQTKAREYAASQSIGRMVEEHYIMYEEVQQNRPIFPLWEKFQRMIIDEFIEGVILGILAVAWILNLVMNSIHPYWYELRHTTKLVKKESIEPEVKKME